VPLERQRVWQMKRLEGPLKTQEVAGAMPPPALVVGGDGT